MEFPVGARLPLQLVHPGFRNGHEQRSPHAHHRTLPNSQSSGKQSFILSIQCPLEIATLDICSGRAAYSDLNPRDDPPSVHK